MRVRSGSITPSTRNQSTANSTLSKAYSYPPPFRYLSELNLIKFFSPIYNNFILIRLINKFKELSHYSFKYAYVTHTNQRGLYKLDLVNLRYTRSVDLTPYNCVPTQVRFSALCK